MKIRLIALLTFITAFAGIVLAETSFTAIPPRSVIAGNKFSVTFRLKNAEGSGIKVPNIDGCTLLYGPATSTMMSYEIINGKQSSSSTVEYIYTYRAVEPGEHTIGEARITVGNKVYTTKPVTFMVLPQGRLGRYRRACRRHQQPDSRQAGISQRCVCENHSQQVTCL